MIVCPDGDTSGGMPDPIETGDTGGLDTTG
jgi:hypothetical protein